MTEQQETLVRRAQQHVEAVQILLRQMDEKDPRVRASLTLLRDAQMNLARSLDS